MKIIPIKDVSAESLIKPIDEKIMMQLVDECLKIRKSDEMYNIYSNFYKTQYTPENFESSEKNLLRYLHSCADKNQGFRTIEQGKEYRWVIVNEGSIGATEYRFYLAPNPNNMHSIVQKFTEEFTKGNIPVKFKYQLSGKTEDCDRIIVYSDAKHKDSIENAISSTYKSNPQLFVESERALHWIYESSTPNVYLAPETPGSSYGEKFASTMIEAKEIFCYMYGITNTNNKIQFNGEEAKKVLDNMEMIVTSLLLRNGLLLSKDGRLIRTKDDICTVYNYETGEITNHCHEHGVHHKVKFSQNSKGKNALFNNFYNVSNVLPEAGISVEHLTPEEKKQQQSNHRR